MDNTEVIRQLREYSLLNIDIIIDNDNFFTSLFDNCVTYRPMGKFTTTRDVNELSENVKKEVLYQQYIRKNIGFQFLTNIEELLEYAKFYYYNSSLSSRQKVRTCNLDFIENEMKEGLDRIRHL
jgi:hypothetical protein